jgi:uncharacterized MnhB-related membrane protein
MNKSQLLKSLLVAVVVIVAGVAVFDPSLVKSVIAAAAFPRVGAAFPRVG